MFVLWLDEIEYNSFNPHVKEQYNITISQKVTVERIINFNTYSRELRKIINVYLS